MRETINIHKLSVASKRNEKRLVTANTGYAEKLKHKPLKLPPYNRRFTETITTELSLATETAIDQHCELLTERSSRKAMGFPVKDLSKGYRVER